MPIRKIHEKVDEIFVGKKQSTVHKVLDLPVKFAGRGHRKYFHSPIEAAAIGYIVGGKEGSAAGLLHVLADKCESVGKTAVKKFLKKMMS